MYITGNIAELGNWKDIKKAKLKWTDGHVWVTDQLLITKPIFQYKFVIINENGE